MALDFFAGCVGGCAGVVVGHPLDTVKIHLQTQSATNPRYTSTLHCLRSLFSQHGLRGIYRGMSSPLAGVAAINAIVFGVYGNTQKSFNISSLSSHFYAGAIAGLFQSFICSPMELAKSRLQISNTSSSPLECLRQIYKTQGTRGVFKGLNITILREIPAFGSYFFTYELLTKSESQKNQVSTSTMLVAGGLAGIVSWVVVYPVDVIKSRMQIDTDGKYVNSVDCLRKSVRAEGVRFLYRGLAPTVVRAFPVNAATFTVVTWTMRLLGDGENALLKNGDGEVLWGRCTDAVYSLKVSEQPAPV